MVVLLTAGRRTQGSADPDRALDELRLLVAAGSPVTDLERLPERCHRAVALAQKVGAPLLEAVEAAQAARDDVRRGERAVAVASAQTRTVAGGLLIAPLLLVPGLARLVGADLVGFYTSSFGLLVLAVGTGLLAFGAVLVVVLVRRVGHASQRTRHHDPLALAAAGLAGVIAYRLFGVAAALPVALLVEHLWSSRRPPAPVTVGVDEVADLVATALAAGVSGPEALRLTADTLPRHATRLRRLAFGLELGMGPDAIAEDPARARHPRPRAGAGGTDPLHRLASLLAAAERTGAAVGPSVRHLAREFRADDLARVLAAAERLPAQLTFPTALCLLPATVLLIGAPIAQTGLSAAGY
ncbi:MAG: type II secretion system F family protein [Nitriliruptoraceae bacterium]